VEYDVYFLSTGPVTSLSDNLSQFSVVISKKTTFKNISLLLFFFVCAGTKQQGPMAGSQEADVEQYNNGGLLDKIKKAFLRGLESLQFELKNFF
jgi:hypothetical protein